MFLFDMSVFEYQEIRGCQGPPRRRIHQAEQIHPCLPDSPVFLSLVQLSPLCEKERTIPDGFGLTRIGCAVLTLIKSLNSLAAVLFYSG
jgi:hypothetical protein